MSARRAVEIVDGRPVCGVCGRQVMTEDDRPAAVPASRVIGDCSDLDLDNWMEADSCICTACMDIADTDHGRHVEVGAAWGQQLYSAMDLARFREWELAREADALARWKEIQV